MFQVIVIPITQFIFFLNIFRKNVIGTVLMDFLQYLTVVPIICLLRKFLLMIFLRMQWHYFLNFKRVKQRKQIINVPEESIRGTIDMLLRKKYMYEQPLLYIPNSTMTLLNGIFKPEKGLKSRKSSQKKSEVYFEWFW